MAIEKAQNDPFPDIHTLTEDVYIDSQNHYIRGVELKDSKLPYGKKEYYWYMTKLNLFYI